MTDEQLTDEWERLELPHTPTHLDRLRIARTLVRRHGAQEGEARYVAGTLREHEAEGRPQAFDETQTREWARAVAAAPDPGGDFDAFLAANPELARPDLLGRGSAGLPTWRGPLERVAPGYEPLAGRAKIALRLLAVSAVLYAVAFGSDLWNRSLAQRIERGDLTAVDRADTSDAIVGILSVAQLVLLVLTTVFFLRWFHRAYKNLAALGASRRYGTGWAIGAWFVPFLNLWRPKQIANDIWRGTDADHGSGLLNAWWTVWIVSNVVDQISFRVTLGSASVSTADGVSAVSDVFDLAAAVLGILVVRALTAREEAATARTG